MKRELWRTCLRTFALVQYNSWNEEGWRQTILYASNQRYQADHGHEQRDKCTWDTDQQSILWSNARSPAPPGAGTGCISAFLIGSHRFAILRHFLYKITVPLLFCAMLGTESHREWIPGLPSALPADQYRYRRHW